MTLYSEAARPTLEEIDAYAHTPLWPQLRAYLAAAYGAGPRLEYSRCGLEPGWNVKFRRGSKSLCTVYLRPGRRGAPFRPCPLRPYGGAADSAPARRR